MKNYEMKQIISQVSEVKISYHPKVKPSDRPLVKDGRDCYELFMERWNLDTIYLREEMMMLCINTAGRVICHYHLSVGGYNGTVADINIILLVAIGSMARNIALAHNHPSGNLTPSRADNEFTQKLKEVAGYHDIKLIDHLIISPEGFCSMASEGLL